MPRGWKTAEKAVCRNPEYPDEARRAGVGGTVTVQVTIDEEGIVVSAEAISGHPLLSRAAVSAAREAKFAAAYLDGQSVKVTGVLVYNFAP